MRKIKGLLIALVIVVLSATSFNCIAQASKVPSFDKHREYFGAVLEISASEASVEVKRKWAEKASLEIADFYYIQEDYVSAAEKYSDFLLSYLDSCANQYLSSEAGIDWPKMVSDTRKDIRLIKQLLGI